MGTRARQPQGRRDAHTVRQVGERRHGCVHAPEGIGLAGIRTLAANTLVMRAVCLRRVTAATGLAAGTERVRMEAEALAGTIRREQAVMEAILELWWTAYAYATAYGSRGS